MQVIEAGKSSGTPVLFLHGFPDQSFGWARQLPFFAANGCYAMAPDLPGYGKSEKPKAISEYKLDRIASAVLAMLSSKGVTACHIVGHDWGAALTWHLVSRHPERFISGTVMCVPPLPVFYDHVRHNRHGQLFRSWYMAFFQLPLVPELLFKAGGGRPLARALAASARRGAFDQAELERYAQAWNEPGAPSGMLNWYRANVRQLGRQESFAKVTVPMLILWGDRDSALNRYMAEDSLAFCERGAVRHFEKGTHWIQREFPDEVNAAILDHIRQHG